MRPLKSERAAITGGRWAMRPSYPQRATKAQILALPLNEFAYSSLERQRMPKYHSFKGKRGETLSFICTCNTNGTQETNLIQFAGRSLGADGSQLVRFLFSCCVAPVVLRWEIEPLQGFSWVKKYVVVILLGRTGWAQWRWMRRSASRTSRSGCVWYWKTRL